MATINICRDTRIENGFLVEEKPLFDSYILIGPQNLGMESSLEGRNEFTLKERDEFTTKFENIEQLQQYLLENGIISSDYCFSKIVGKYLFKSAKNYIDNPELFIEDFIKVMKDNQSGFNIMYYSITCETKQYSGEPTQEKEKRRALLKIILRKDTDPQIKETKTRELLQLMIYSQKTRYGKKGTVKLEYPRGYHYEMFRDLIFELLAIQEKEKQKGTKKEDKTITLKDKYFVKCNCPICNGTGLTTDTEVTKIWPGIATICKECYGHGYVLAKKECIITEDDTFVKINCPDGKPMTLTRFTKGISMDKIGEHDIEGVAYIPNEHDENALTSFISWYEFKRGLYPEPTCPKILFETYEPGKKLGWCRGDKCTNRKLKPHCDNHAYGYGTPTEHIRSRNRVYPPTPNK